MCARMHTHVHRSGALSNHLPPHLSPQDRRENKLFTCTHEHMYTHIRVGTCSLINLSSKSVLLLLKELLTTSTPDAKEMDCIWWFAMICREFIKDRCEHYTLYRSLLFCNGVFDYVYHVQQNQTPKIEKQLYEPESSLRVHCRYQLSNITDAPTKYSSSNMYWRINKFSKSWGIFVCLFCMDLTYKTKCAQYTILKSPFYSKCHNQNRYLILPLWWKHLEQKRGKLTSQRMCRIIHKSWSFRYTNIHNILLPWIRLLGWNCVQNKMSTKNRHNLAGRKQQVSWKRNKNRRGCGHADLFGIGCHQI